MPTNYVNLEENPELQTRTTASTLIAVCVTLGREPRPFMFRKCKITNGCCFKLLNVRYLLCSNRTLILIPFNRLLLLT